MNSFVKKFLGACLLASLAVGVFAGPATMNFGNLPLWFEAGQGEAAAQFVAHGRDSAITISPAGVQFALYQANHTLASARMTFVRANPLAKIAGNEELAAKINYFNGDNPDHWQAGMNAFGRVRVEKIYDGINVVYYGNQQRLEYDFDLEAGVKPEVIAIRFEGADKVSVNSRGELTVELDGRQIIQHEPVAYQISGGVHRELEAHYRLLDAHTVGFSVGHYNADLPLVIDPVLSYSTFFGGNDNDTVWSVALGASDNSVYLAGQTLSTKLNSTRAFATPGAYRTNFQGGTQFGDAFVAKFHDLGTNPVSLNDIATNLIYCTYLGGSSDDAAYALAVDEAGHAFVTGVTFSTNFPYTNQIIFQEPNGQIFNGKTNQAAKLDPNLAAFPSDVFVTELDTNGAGLIYSTYLGGASSESAFALALDPEDNAYITGYTSSTNFPVTANAYQPYFASVYNLYKGCNVFVSEISAETNGGTTLNYSTYLGGTNIDSGNAIAFNNGYLAVAGSTSSSNFPTVNWLGEFSAGGTNYQGNVLNSRHDNINNNLQIAPIDNDGFVALFQKNGSTLNQNPVYSTFLGGTNTDVAYGVAVDPVGDVVVVGATTSTNFPYLVSPGQVALNSYVRTNTTGIFVTNSFVTEISLNGGTNPVIEGSQIFGSFGNDVAEAVALDAAGNIFIAGRANSLTNYNATRTNLVGWLNPTNSGPTDVYVTAIGSNFSSLLYSAYFGSSDSEFADAIAVGSDDSVYVAGQTTWRSGAAINFPVLNAWEPTPPDGNNGFLTKIWLNPPVPPVLTPVNTGTNLLISWSAVPLAQINTNTLFLQTTTNLLSSTNWTTVTQTPVATKQVIVGLGGTYTNQAYTYKFNPTNQMRYFRLREHSR